MLSNKGSKKTLLNHGIWQYNYHQEKRLLNKERNKKMKTYENKTYLLFVYPLVAIILHRVSSCNKYYHAHIIMYKLERRPPITYRSLIVVAYRL
jgi:hypothetical protein